MDSPRICSSSGTPGQAQEKNPQGAWTHRGAEGNRRPHSAGEDQGQKKGAPPLRNPGKIMFSAFSLSSPAVMRRPRLFRGLPCLTHTDELIKITTNRPNQPVRKKNNNI